MLYLAPMLTGCWLVLGSDVVTNVGLQGKVTTPIPAASWVTPTQFDPTLGEAVQTCTDPIAPQPSSPQAPFGTQHWATSPIYGTTIGSLAAISNRYPI